jgi:hypothetical protein
MLVPNVIGAPTEEEKRAIREWRKNDNRVAGWLLAIMEPHISKIMTFQDSAQGMWKKAERLYGKNKTTHMYINCNKNFIETNNSRTKQSLRHLLYYKKRLTSSDCTDLLPKNPDEILKREEQNEIFRFLACLDSSYESVRSQDSTTTQSPFS